jgi:hypothetical protein
MPALRKKKLSGQAKDKECIICWARFLTLPDSKCIFIITISTTPQSFSIIITYHQKKKRLHYY